MGSLRAPPDDSHESPARWPAEAGCPANEIAVTGPLTLEEVARYMKAAGQERLAQSASGVL